MSLKNINKQARKSLFVFAGFFMFLMSPALLAEPVFLSHVEVLASSCAACHGTNGNSVGGTPVLAGLDKDHFVTQMMAFRDKQRPSTVMYHHAKGLSVEEINQLGDFFAVQPRVTSVEPPSIEMKEE